jgi:hypothetical protein
VTLSLSLRFHLRQNAQEQNFDGMHSVSKERDRAYSSSYWDSQRLTQIFVAGRSEQPFSDSTSEFRLLFCFLFFLVHSPRALSLSNGHISEQPFSSTNPEPCHQSTLHSREQLSSDSPSEFPLLFHFLIFLTTTQKFATSRLGIAGIIFLVTSAHSFSFASSRLSSTNPELYH